jgi:energy-coupling factor transporter ATP-binding protein EcfA2
MHALLQGLCARHHPAVLLVTHDVDEAILLADRIVVLVDGAIAFDAEVSVATPRNRGDVNFLALRSRLLSELGVDESVPNPPAPSPRLVRPGGAVPIVPAQSFDSLPNDFDNKEILQ